jgi:hypothetical protein
MSVDDRLRRGLEANAQSFEPQGEARLDRVRGRWRRRRLVLGGVLAGVVLLAGSGAALGWLLGGGGPSGGRGVDPVDAPSTTLTAPHPAIPASNWRKVVTRDELAAAGADQAFLREHLGSARRMPVLLSFSQDVFSQSARYAEGWSGGDAGRVSYDDEGRLVLTSSSTECFGCEFTLDWRLEPGELHLSDATGALDPVDRVMYLGTWRSADG